MEQSIYLHGAYILECVGGRDLYKNKDIFITYILSVISAMEEMRQDERNVVKVGVMYMIV